MHASLCILITITATVTESNTQQSNGTHSKCPVYHYTGGKRSVHIHIIIHMSYLCIIIQCT